MKRRRERYIPRAHRQHPYSGCLVDIRKRIDPLGYALNLPSRKAKKTKYINAVDRSCTRKFRAWCEYCKFGAS